MDHLLRQLWALPTELYDTILDDVLTLQIPAVTPVTEDYKPPNQLRLCRGLRSVVANTYYATAEFHFDDVSLLLKWIASLPQHHRQLLQCVRLNVNPRAFIDPVLAFTELRIESLRVHTVLHRKIPYQQDWNCVFVNALKRVEASKWAAVWISIGDHPRTKWRLLTGYQY